MNEDILNGLKQAYGLTEAVSIKKAELFVKSHYGKDYYVAFNYKGTEIRVASQFDSEQEALDYIENDIKKDYSIKENNKIFKITEAITRQQQLSTNPLKTNNDITKKTLIEIDIQSIEDLNDNVIQSEIQANQFIKDLSKQQNLKLSYNNSFDNETNWNITIQGTIEDICKLLCGYLEPEISNSDDLSYQLENYINKKTFKKRDILLFVANSTNLYIN